MVLGATKGKKNLRLIEHETKKEYTVKEFLRYLNTNHPKLKKIESTLHGTFESTKYGSGFNFNEIREYQIGDDLRHISWSATARTNTLQTKEYFAEKELNSVFLIDISTSMFCGKKAETFLNLCAFLLSLAATFSEKIGGLFFSDNIKYHFQMSSAASQSNIVFQSLLNYYLSLSENLNPEPASTNLSKALDFSKRYFIKKGLIFIVSDFINISNWEKIFYEYSKKQNIHSFQIYDQVDFMIPKSGYACLIDPETKEQFFVNTDNEIVQESYKGVMANKQTNLINFLKSALISHMVIEHSDFEHIKVN